MSETTSQTGSRPNSGALFPERNRKSDRAPSQTGFVLISPDILGDIDPITGCYRLRIAAWTKSGRGGGDFLSLAVERPRPPREDSGGGGDRGYSRPSRPPNGTWDAPPARAAANGGFDAVIDDEIPF